jgi:filamentous hemagglutinin family protein
MAGKGPSLHVRSGLIGVVILVGFVLQAAVSLGQTPSQITLDGTMGGLPRTLPKDASNNIQIRAEFGQTRGANLFHSFGQFNVLDGERAAFTGPSSIANILGRVTGGDVSRIFGTVASEIPGANLFLLNPRGFLFGPNARLDVSGSFHASTASYVAFSDGTRFSAQPVAGEVLSIAQPSAFGFLGANGGAAPTITVQGLLQVPEGKTLSLVGGEVRIEGGTLAAPGGRVQIVSTRAPVGSEAEVSLNGSFDANAFATLGQIDITGNALVGATEVVLTPEDLPIGNGGGTVLIRGGALTVDGSRILADVAGDVAGARLIDVQVTGEMTLSNSASISALTITADRGGDVRVASDSLRLRGSSFIETGTFFGSGSAGDLSVTTRTLSLMGSARIDSLSSSGTGQGGNLTVSVDTLDMRESSLIETANFGDGGAGDLSVVGRNLMVTDGARIHSITNLGIGRGGNVSVSATESLTMSGRDVFGTPSGIVSETLFDGSGGRVTVSTPSVTLADGATVSSTTFFGAGAAGDITVDTGSLSLTGGSTIASQVGSDSQGPGGRVTVTASGSALVSGESGGIISASSGIAGFGGAPGELVVNAGALTLTDGAVIGTNNILGPQSGNISITARSVVISRGGTVTSQALDQNAGRVTISAPTITLNNGFVNTSTIGTEAAGDILVDAGTLALGAGAQVASSSSDLASGRGGSVTVTASDVVSIAGTAPVPNFFTQDASSGLFSTAANIGDAGQITVTAPALTIGAGGKISVRSTGSGNAGSMFLNVGSLSLSGSGALVSDAAAAGAGGNINVTAGQVDLSGGTMSARSFGTGNAGNIVVHSNDALTASGSSITTQATIADGGNIELTAPRLIHLVDSRVTTSVESSFGAGGNILIDPQFLVLSGTQIRADAFGGPGGNVRLVADVFLTQSSVISASSALGVPGTINIEATVSDVSGTVTPLPEGALQAATLLGASCATRLAGGKVSSLVLAGRDSIAADPSGLLPSPLVAEGPVETRLSWGGGHRLEGSALSGLQLMSWAAPPGHLCR